MGNQNTANKNRQKQQDIEDFKEPKVPRLLKTPYRSVEDFNDEYCQKLMKDIISVVISSETEEHERLKWNMLLIGPCLAGKSSFINSVLSISNEEYVNGAFAGGDSLISISSKYKSYSGGSIDNLKLFDTAGLVESKGFNIDNLPSILSGKIKEGYDFSAGKVISDEDNYYRKNPTEADIIHCVIYVVDICSLSTIDDSLRAMISKLQKTQIDSEVQRVLILTKCDELCDYVKNDAENIYKSAAVSEEIDRARTIFGISGGNIHPIVNYGERVTTINPKMNVPILLALKQCVTFSKQFLKNKYRRTENESQ